MDEQATIPIKVTSKLISQISFITKAEKKNRFKGFSIFRYGDSINFNSTTGK